MEFCEFPEFDLDFGPRIYYRNTFKITLGSTLNLYGYRFWVVYVGIGISIGIGVGIDFGVGVGLCFFLFACRAR